MKWIRDLYDWILKWSDSKYGTVALVVLAFSESSFFPIPPDVLLIALGSIVGAIFGYGIGQFLWWSGEGVFSGLAIFFFDAIPGFTRDMFYQIQDKYETWNFWIIFTAGFTPIPFKLFTITSGAFSINFPMFIIASTISRSARFLLVSGLIWKYGAPIQDFIDRYFNKLAILFTILLIGGFFLIKYLL